MSGEQPKASRRGRPAKISRQTIVATASEIGISDLTFAEVARRLDVTLPTIYNHVKDREELLHLTAGILEQRYTLPASEDMDWIAWWTAAAPAIKSIYNQNAGLASVLMGRPIANTPPIARHWLTAQVVAERSGFTPLMGLWANMAVFEFTYAWAAHEDQGRAPPDDPGAHDLDAAFERESPRYGEAAAQARSRPIDLRFRTTLQALLAGFYARRENTPSDG